MAGSGRIPDVVLAAYGPLDGEVRRSGGVVWVVNGASSGEVELAAADATLTPGEIARVLAWQHRLLNFTATPLGDIVAAYNRRNTDTDSLLLAGSNTGNWADPVTGLGLRIADTYSVSETREDAFDLYASGPFQLFGRQHDLVVGVNHYDRDFDDPRRHQLAPVQRGRLPQHLQLGRQHRQADHLQLRHSLQHDYHH
jgi:hypothetical protein